MKTHVTFRVKLALLIFLIGLSAYGAEAPVRPALPTHRPNLDIMICAHRGVKKRAPENTLPAIEKAVELGYDYVEIDVRYTKDGVPVLMHDDWIDRTTTGVGPLYIYRLDTLKKLDAGIWKGWKFRGTRVPAVEEAFQVMQGKISLYLDQKEPPTPELIRLMKQYGFYPGNLIIVGSGEKTKKFLEYEPKAPVMPRLHPTGEVEDLLREFPSARAFNTSCDTVTAEMIDEAHKHGIMIFTNILHLPPWQSERECMKRPIMLGADVVQFDNVDLFFDVLDEIKKERAE
jgi:glycerophosphoryl diester phosphodiesterase